MADERKQQLGSDASKGDEEALAALIAAAGAAVGGAVAVKKLVRWLASSGKSAPEHAQEHFLRGERFAAQGDRDSANQEFYRCLLHNPQHVLCHNAIAWDLATRRVLLEQALAHAQAAVNLAPHNPALLDTLAEVHFARGDLGSCVNVTQRALQLVHPTDLSTQFALHLRMGYLLQGQHQYAQSALAFQAALGSGSGSRPYDLATAYYGLAVSLTQLNDFRGAHSALKSAQAIRQHPDFDALESQIMVRGGLVPTSSGPLVFISYDRRDEEAVVQLARRVAAEGFEPWLDKFKLLPGDNYEREIKKAVRRCAAFVVCLSPEFNREGFRQREVRWALDALGNRPLGQDFLIPYVVRPFSSEELPEWIDEHKIHTDLHRRTDVDSLILKLKQMTRA